MNQNASTLDIKYCFLDLRSPCFKDYEQYISIVYNYLIEVILLKHSMVNRENWF